MPIKSVKMKILKNKKMRFFLMSQGSLNPKIRFLGQKVWPVARAQTHTQTDGQTDRVTTEGTLSGFQDFFLQPIIKDRPNTNDTASNNNKTRPDVEINAKLFKWTGDLTLLTSEVSSQMWSWVLIGEMYQTVSSWFVNSTYVYLDLLELTST